MIHLHLNTSLNWLSLAYLVCESSLYPVNVKTWWFSDNFTSVSALFGLQTTEIALSQSHQALFDLYLSLSEYGAASCDRVADNLGHGCLFLINVHAAAESRDKNTIPGSVIISFEYNALMPCGRVASGDAVE